MTVPLSTVVPGQEHVLTGSWWLSGQSTENGRSQTNLNSPEARFQGTGVRWRRAARHLLFCRVDASASTVVSCVSSPPSLIHNSMIMAITACGQRGKSGQEWPGADGAFRQQVSMARTDSRQAAERWLL